MRSKKLTINLPWHIWEGTSKEHLVERLRDRFQVYLNREDSDFPYEYLIEGDFVVDRDSDISIEVVEFCEIQRKLSLTVALSFTLKRSKNTQHAEATRAALQTVRFEIDPDEGEVDAYV